MDDDQAIRLIEEFDKRLEDLEEAVKCIADTLQNICSGVDGVVHETRKSMYSGKLANRQGDFEPFRDLYGSLSPGRDIINDLIETMANQRVSEDGIDDYVENALSTLRGRFGKIIGLKEPEIAEVGPMDDKKEEPKGEIEVKVEDAKPDAVNDLMKNLLNLNKKKMEV